MLEVTVRDAVLLIEAAEGVLVESLNGFPCRREGGTWRVELGSLLSDQALDPVLAFTFPVGALGSSHAISIGLADRSHTLATGASVAFRYASHQENDAQPRERAIDRRVASLYAAKAAQDALVLNRDGDYEAARRTLDACGRWIGEYAGNDPELLAILEMLKHKGQRFTQMMRASERKSEYAVTSSSLKSRPSAPRSTRR